ncbi:MAG: hypothetical protein MZU95_08945 [Desulfomicrobium escambiense]|nr:hypothetical protein [Desulfomicrobium escambiense]
MVRYDGVPRLYYQDEEGGPEVLIISATPAADPSTSAGQITISVTGDTDGSVFVDELHFLDPVGEFSLAGRGAFSWNRDGAMAGTQGRAVLSDPGVSARISGTVSGDSSFAGYLDGRISVGPAKLAANLRQGFTDGRFTDGAFGHALELPLKGFSLTDSFQHDSGSGRFGRRDSLTMNTRGFGLALEQSATYGGSNLEQAWDLKLNAGTLVSISGSLSNAAAGKSTCPPATARPGSTRSGISCRPSKEESSRRSTELRSVWRFGGGTLNLSAFPWTFGRVLPESRGFFLGGSAVRLGHPGGQRIRRALLQPLLEPRRGVHGPDLRGGLGRLAEGLRRSRVPVPIDTLRGVLRPLHRGLLPITAVPGTSSASYKPEAGIILGRRYGSRWTDPLIPSKAALSLQRELTSSLETVTDALVWEASASMAAINLFGARGTYRLSQLYSVDEYSQRFTGP